MSRPTANILDLPGELRDDIVAHLDIRDVLSLSLTCKYFRMVMESRHTWMKFVQRTQSQPHISRMEEPLEDYTTQELKDWTVRRHETRKSLRLGSRATSHYIPGTNGAEESVLLPGGRWFLFENHPGHICYADCDAPTPDAQPLITFENIVPTCIETQFVIWRDPDSPRMSFRTAILHWYDREDGDRGYQIHFFKIDLAGHGCSAKLVAEPLHQYRGSVLSRESSRECIRGNYFYQMHNVRIYGISKRLANPRATLEILDYGRGSTATKQVKLIDFYYSLHPWYFNVLPDGRILISGATEVVIYPDPLPIAGNELKTLIPIHVINGLGFQMRGGSVTMSPWYLGLDSSMVVYGRSNKQMVAAWVPHDGMPPVGKRIEYYMPTIDGRFTLGLFTGATMISRNCISLFNYPWSDSQSQIESDEQIMMAGRVFNMEQETDDDTHSDAEWDPGYVKIKYLDEEIGRVIIQDRHRGYFVVDVGLMNQ